MFEYKFIFCLTGCGADNANTKIDSDPLVEDGDVAVETPPIPTSDCMVGYGPSGTLYSLHDLKHELKRSDASKSIVTLDFCRDKQKMSHPVVKLR